MITIPEIKLTKIYEIRLNAEELFFLVSAVSELLYQIDEGEASGYSLGEGLKIILAVNKLNVKALKVHAITEEILAEFEEKYPNLLRLLKSSKVRRNK